MVHIAGSLSSDSGRERALTTAGAHVSSTLDSGRTVAQRGRPSGGGLRAAQGAGEHEAQQRTRPHVGGVGWIEAVQYLVSAMSGFDVMGGAEVFAMPFRAGLDVVAISRRLGHSLPVVTLRISAHLFKRDDSGAVAAIEAVMRTQGQQAKR